MFQSKQTDITIDNKLFREFFNNLLSTTMVSLPHSLQLIAWRSSRDNCLLHIRDFQNVFSLKRTYRLADQKRRYQKENPSYLINGCLSFRCRKQTWWGYFTFLRPPWSFMEKNHRSMLTRAYLPVGLLQSQNWGRKEVSNKFGRFVTV